MHFFDTNILVAAFDGEDSWHQRAFAVFARHAEEGAIAVHTIAETFSILTGRRGWRAKQAFEILDANTALLKKICLICLRSFIAANNVKPVHSLVQGLGLPLSVRLLKTIMDLYG